MALEPASGRAMTASLNVAGGSSWIAYTDENSWKPSLRGFPSYLSFLPEAPPGSPGNDHRKLPTSFQRGSKTMHSVVCSKYCVPLTKVLPAQAIPLPGPNQPVGEEVPTLGLSGLPSRGMIAGNSHPF